MSNTIEYRPVVINKATYDKLLRTDKPSDAIALYNFYYYTAVWQETNQAKATDKYCMKGLKMGRNRFRRAKKILLELGLIQAIKYVNKKNRFEGHYIKVNYYARRETVNKATFSTSQVSHLVEKQPINAYSNNSLNAYSNNINNGSFKKKTSSSSFFKFHEIPFANPLPDNIYSTIEFYLQSYKNKTGKEHPRLNADQWDRVFTTLVRFDEDKGGIEDTWWFELVDNYLYANFKSKDVDYNINHFATEGILEKRFLEVYF